MVRRMSSHYSTKLFLLAILLPPINAYWKQKGMLKLYHIRFPNPLEGMSVLVYSNFYQQYSNYKDPDLPGSVYYVQIELLNEKCIIQEALLS